MSVEAFSSLKQTLINFDLAVREIRFSSNSNNMQNLAEYGTSVALGAGLGGVVYRAVTPGDERDIEGYIKYSSMGSIVGAGSYVIVRVLRNDG